MQDISINTILIRFVRHHIGWLLLPVSLAIAVTAIAESSSPQWVHGSWVNVRSTPSSTATIVTRVTANTKVALLSRAGKWCKVRTYPANINGFVACRLLGDKPLSLDVIGRQRLPNGKPNPAFSAVRSFWIAPSVVRLKQAGEFFWGTMLSDEDRAREHPDMYSKTSDGQPQFNWDTRPQPHRFPIPEFEAMKTLLGKGVVAHPERRPKIIPWSDFNIDEKQRRRSSTTIKGRWFQSEHIDLMKKGKLDKVIPSYFKKVEDLAPPSASVEQISAHFGIRERMRVISGPQWVYFRHESPYVRGNWDVGSTELSLEKPVIEYVIGRQGLAAASEWAAVELDDITLDYACTEGFSIKQRAKQRLPGYPKIKNPLVWFFTPKALLKKKVAIKTFARRLNAASEKSNLRGLAQSLLVMHEIDLDADAVADLSVWEVMGKSALGASEEFAVLRIIFVNINGVWHFLDMDSLGECT